jgi:hypothetical protein
MYKLNEKFLNREELIEQAIDDDLGFPVSLVCFALFSSLNGSTQSLYDVVNKGISNKTKRISQKQIDDSIILLENNNYICK